MTKKLWQIDHTANALIEAYTAGEDVLFDQQLAVYDIYGSLAHATMLQQQKLISVDDLQHIRTGLLKLLSSFQNNTLTVTLEDEDIHTKIESELTHMYPDAGSKLHTGRSRNDQVLVDIRLYSKQKLTTVALLVLDLITVLSQQASRFRDIPLAGMTHMQPAMLSSFGLWLSAFAESLLDDLQVLKTAYALNDQSPLGSGAGYGVTLPIDRELTAQLLGFTKVQNNALYCQNSRGKIEATILHALCQIMATLNKLATDCLVFTTEPFSYITFDKTLGTGSSIMPQKLNWDALELLRSKYHQLLAAQLQISSSVASIPSGYNRDVQQTKGSLITAYNTAVQSIQVAQLHLSTIHINQQQVTKHIPKQLFATHWAYLLVSEQGMPFRTAYQYVKRHLKEIPEFDGAQLLRLAVSQGSTGNLQLAALRAKIRLERAHWTSQQTHFTQTVDKLLKKEKYANHHQL